MLWATIILLLRRYRQRHPREFRLLLAKAIMTARIAALLLLALVTALAAHTQTKTLAYNIRQQGKTVGTLQVKEETANGKSLFRLHSQVHTRFVIPLHFKAVEEAHFENNILVFSSVSRSMNGRQKLAQTVHLQGRRFQVSKGSKKEEMPLYPIRHTMLTLYLNEPVALTHVFSDAFQQMVPVHKLAANHYKVQFPDGAYNEFFYTEGTCAKVLLHHSLYQAEMELKK